MVIRFFTLMMLLFSCSIGIAEPYLAAKTGLKCMSCHVSPTGGGMRTEFGLAFGQTLSSDSSESSILTSQINSYLRLGGDFRASTQVIETPQQQSQFSTQTDRVSLYLHAEMSPQLDFYIDQQLAPNSLNRTAWVKYQSEDKSRYIRAGKFFLPYGLRLEDDSAFIRQVSGISFFTADNGVELGFDRDKWSMQLALSNGTAGATDNNREKQISFRAAYIKPIWRLGTSLNSNNGPLVKREMFNLFAMLNLFDSQWLIEMDRITDSGGISVTQHVFLLELNKEIIKGHNLKLTWEAHDPDADTDGELRKRSSLVWEYFPLRQLQLRSGIRIGDADPLNPQDNRDELFVSLHTWF